MRRSDFPLPIPDDLWIRRPAPAWLSIRSDRKESHFLPPGSWICGPAPWDRPELGIKGSHRACPREGGGSWDAHPVPMPCSPTPVGPRHPTNAVLRCGPRTQYDEGSNGLTISGLHHTASAPAVYASQPHRCGPRKTRLRRVVSPYREGVEPSGHHKRFPLTNCP